MFLAKPKKDPLTRAFVHGSMLEKTYDFNKYSDQEIRPVHIPSGGADKVHNGTVVPEGNKVQKLYA